MGRPDCIRPRHQAQRSRLGCARFQRGLEARSGLALTWVCRERTYDRARAGEKRARYGWLHQQVRASWVPLVAGGGVNCARCKLPIAPGEPWDMGHDDQRPFTYAGPEHRACNRATSGRGTARSSEWAALDERVPSGRVRCGECGWLIGQTTLGSRVASTDRSTSSAKGHLPSRRRSPRASGRRTGGEIRGDRPRPRREGQADPPARPRGPQ